MKLALRTDPSSSASWVDRLAHDAVKSRMVTKYPHGGLVIGSTLYHSTSKKGVHSTQDWEPDKWELFEFDGNEELALQRFKEREGNKYDWVGLLPFVGIPGSDRKRDYCFELIYYMMTGTYPTQLVTAETLLVLVLNKQNQQKG